MKDENEDEEEEEMASVSLTFAVRTRSLCSRGCALKSCSIFLSEFIDMFGLIRK